jgi:hypothetical protein
MVPDPGVNKWRLLIAQRKNFVSFDMADVNYTLGI